MTRPRTAFLVLLAVLAAAAFAGAYVVARGGDEPSGAATGVEPLDGRTAPRVDARYTVAGVLPALRGTRTRRRSRPGSPARAAAPAPTTPPERPPAQAASPAPPAASPAPAPAPAPSGLAPAPRGSGTPDPPPADSGGGDDIAAE